MSRGVVVFALVLLVALGVVACSLVPSVSAEGEKQPEAMARDLWQKMQKANYRQNWTTVPGKGTFYQGQPPHGALLSTYLNTEAVKGMKEKAGLMPKDAIIVKENYSPKKELVAVTVMYKEPGFDPEHKDWFWAKYGPKGEVQVSGKGVGCIACHGSVQSNDYVFTFPVAPLKSVGR